MNKIQEIDERGWWTTLIAPETAPYAREERLTQVSNALTTLAPVFWPLAFEVELCWRELNTGLPAPTYVEPPIHLLVLAGSESRVAIRPSVASPPSPVMLPRLDTAAIGALLENGESPDPNLILDWLRIRSLAVAVRAFEPLESITITQLGRSIPAYEPNWFAGPLGHQGFAVWPPARIEFRSEATVRFTMVVHWSGWLHQGTRERDAIEAAIFQCQANGWMAESSPPA